MDDQPITKARHAEQELEAALATLDDLGEKILAAYVQLPLDWLREKYRLTIPH